MGLTRYNCFLGTARGFLLSTTEKPKEIKHVKPDFSAEVTALCFYKEQEEIAIGYKNGTVHRYNPSENIYLDTLSLEGNGGIVGLGSINDDIIAGKSDGVINIWNPKKNKHFKVNLDDTSTLECMVLNNTRNLIGTGGEHNDFKLWDIETQTCVFKAKSMGHDKLNLPIPTSIRGITYFPDDPNLNCCCTKEGHVLLYDDRKQRRPVIKFSESKASYTTISCAYRERQCLVGTTKGYMQLLDMKAGKCLKTVTSFTGSVTSIFCDPMEPYVFSTSLDRHLRVHNLETKELLHKVYMKVNLTSLLIRTIIKEETSEDADNSKKDQKTNNIDDEYESIFNEMEVIVDKETKTKEKTKRSIDQSIECEVAEKKAKKKHKKEKSDKHVKAKKKKTLIKNIFAL